jgi:hypothetical protein
MTVQRTASIKEFISIPTQPLHYRALNFLMVRGGGRAHQYINQFNQEKLAFSPIPYVALLLN